MRKIKKNFPSLRLYLTILFYLRDYVTFTQVQSFWIRKQRLPLRDCQMEVDLIWFWLKWINQVSILVYNSFWIFFHQIAFQHSSISFVSFDIFSRHFGNLMVFHEFFHFIHMNMNYHLITIESPPNHHGPKKLSLNHYFIL